MGCEQGDWYIWMRVWGQQDTRQGNWGHQLWDAGTIVGQGLGMSNIGTLIIIAKVRGTCDISFFVKICYLLSTLDSIIQNHIGHVMILAQNISLYRSKRTDYCD